MPSGGILPFLNGFICEIDNACNKYPKEVSNSIELRNFTQSSIEYLNENNLIVSASVLVDYGIPFLKQRQKAQEITSKATLIIVVCIENKKWLK